MFWCFLKLLFPRLKRAPLPLPDLLTLRKQSCLLCSETWCCAYRDGSFIARLRIAATKREDTDSARYTRGAYQKTLTESAGALVQDALGSYDVLTLGHGRCRRWWDRYILFSRKRSLRHFSGSFCLWRNLPADVHRMTNHTALERTNLMQIPANQLSVQPFS